MTREELLNPALQITTIDSAKQYIQGLLANDLMFHFDDSALDCLTPELTNEEAQLVDDRVSEIHLVKGDWEPHGCPIGYALDTTSGVA